MADFYRYLRLEIVLASLAGCFLLSGCRTGQTDVDRVRHAELMEKFRMSEWAVDVRTKAMVYLYGKTETTPHELLCGMEIGPSDATIYLWPNTDAGQMCLSASTASCAVCGPDYGVHFQPVNMSEKLIVGHRICLMEGCGPSKGKSLWIQIVECVTDEMPERNYFAGTWRSSRCKDPVLMCEDGTWRVVDGAGRLQMSGTWCLRGNHIVSTFDHLSKNFQDVTTVLTISKDEYVEQEMDGSKTCFTKIGGQPD